MNIALIFVQDALLCLRRDGAQWRSMPVEGEPAISLMHFSAGRLQEVLRSKRHEQTVAECVITVLHHPQSAALAAPACRPCWLKVMGGWTAWRWRPGRRC